MLPFELMFKGVSVAPLLIALKRQPHLWNVHTLRTEEYNTPHKQVSDMWVRYNDFKNFTGDREEFNSEHDSVWYPAYYALPQLREIIFQLMTAVEGERLGGVLITKIPPGGGVLPHVDKGWHAEYYDKYLISVQSNLKQVFGFEDGSFVSEPGDVYKFDNSKAHFVTNNSNEDRISLIICIRSNRIGV